MIKSLKGSLILYRYVIGISYTWLHTYGKSEYTRINPNIDIDIYY